MSDDYITAAAMGKRLSLAPKTVLSWARRKKIPCHRLSRRVVRFNLAEVLGVLESREILQAMERDDHPAACAAQPLLFARNVAARDDHPAACAAQPLLFARNVAAIDQALDSWYRVSGDLGF